MADPFVREPLVAIVTVTFNAEHVIEDFLASLVSQTYSNWRLVIVDNASADRTLLKLESVRDDPRIEVISCDRNSGAAEGNNIGLERVRALDPAYILLTNNDVAFGRNVLAEMLTAKRSVNAGAVSATLLFESPAQQAWYDGGSITTTVGVRCVHRSPDLPRAQRLSVYGTGYAPTTFLLFDAEVIDAVGCLDEQYFAYWEDADYLWRLRAGGFGVWVARDVSVIHKVSQASGGAGSHYSNQQYYKNQILFAKKHFSFSKVTMTVMAALMRILGLSVLRRDSFSLSRSKLRGLLHGLSIRPVHKGQETGWAQLSRRPRA